jgi:glycosyltransferase involved in cell wall biosynthesis
VPPHGVEELGQPEEDVYIVRTLDPRKNLPALVEAYARLLSAEDIAEHLVLAGQCGWSVQELLSRVGGAHLRGRVHMAGYVAEADLPKLYAGARLFVYPSLLEGFGFPPLEAMASGRLLTDAGARSRCVDAGLRRAAEFRWDLCARRTRECYEEVSRVVSPGLARA